MKKIMEKLIANMSVAEKKEFSAMLEREIRRDNAKKFIPPTVEEVRAYCVERKNNVDPQRFVDFYESKGWLVGKTKMKSWQAAVRNWEARNRAEQKNNRDGGGIYDQF